MEDVFNPERTKILLNRGIAPNSKSRRRRSPMTLVLQDAARDTREQQRQGLFRRRYVEQSPWWYRGEYHLAFMLVVTLGTIAFCWTQIENSKAWEWTLII